MHESVPPDDTPQLASGVEFGTRGCLTSLLCSVVCGFITYCVLAFLVLPFASDQPQPPLPPSSDEWRITGSELITDADIVSFSIIPIVFVAIVLGGILGVIIGSKRR